MYSCEPASASRSAGRSGSRGSGRASPRRARACGRPRRRSPSRRASSPRARPRRGRRPPPRTAPGRPGARSLPSSLEAERVGEALGRVDRQHRDLLAAGRHPGGDRRRGRRLADAARAGADADRACPRASPRPALIRRHLRRERSSASTPSSGSKRNGSVADRGRVSSRAASSCSRWAAARAALVERRPDRRRPPAPRRRRQLRRRRSLARRRSAPGRGRS